MLFFFSFRVLKNAKINEVEIVAKIIGKDCLPVSKITLRFNPNTSSTTAYWSIFLDVNFIPDTKEVLSLKNIVIIIPAIIAITGPPIIGNISPTNHDGTAIAKHNKNLCNSS